MADKIRLGFVGANVRSAWASVSHFPALLASPDVELTAVCTTRQETAEEARTALGAKLAFADWREMVRRPRSTRWPWWCASPSTTARPGRRWKPASTSTPSGRSAATTAEAEELAALARASGMQTVVGLQSRVSPTLMYMKELLETGYVGELLSINVSGFRATARRRCRRARTWQADASLGANTLTIAFGHVDRRAAICRRRLRAGRAAWSRRRPRSGSRPTPSRPIDVTSPDNVLVSGELASGAVASVHVGAVPWAGRGFRMEIYGREGTLVVDRQRLVAARRDAPRARRARHERRWRTWRCRSASCSSRPIFRAATRSTSGQMYSLFAEAIRTGENRAPTFDTAVGLHRFLDADHQSSDAAREASLSRAVPFDQGAAGAHRD